MGNEQSQPQVDDEGLPSALVIVGPSGVGKGTLIHQLMSGSNSFGFSCSHTTRAPREGEKVGLVVVNQAHHLPIIVAAIRSIYTCCSFGCRGSHFRPGHITAPVRF